MAIHKLKHRQGRHNKQELPHFASSCFTCLTNIQHLPYAKYSRVVGEGLSVEVDFSTVIKKARSSALLYPWEEHSKIKDKP